MTDDDKEDDQERDAPGGHDTDRSLNELLQELRVAQTGIQVFVAFLLTIPFAPAFKDLDEAQRNLYAADLTCAVAATALLVSPVAIHRAIFGERLRPTLVSFANGLTLVGLMLLLVAMVLGVALVATVVFESGTVGRYWLPISAAVTLVLAWIVLPLVIRITRPQGRPGSGKAASTGGPE
jgi:hypothetical protein